MDKCVCLGFSNTATEESKSLIKQIVLSFVFVSAGLYTGSQAS